MFSLPLPPAGREGPMAWAGAAAARNAADADNTAPFTALLALATATDTGVEVGGDAARTCAMVG